MALSPDFNTGTFKKPPRKFSSNSIAIDLCSEVRNIVFVSIVALSGNLIFIEIIVLAERLKE